MRSTKTIACLLLAAVLLLLVGYQSGSVNAVEAVSPARIGTVSIRTVLEKSKKNADWEVKMTAEGDKISAQLKSIRDELTAIDSASKAFKPGSSEYSGKMLEYMEKEASLKAKENFFQQDFAGKQAKWAESLFQKALGAVEKVAKDKGLDVVLAKEDYEFPSKSANELMLTIKTSKVLYSGTNLDITSDVLAVLDATD